MKTYTQERGSLKPSSSDRNVVSLEARDGPERPDRNGDRGLKTVELGLTLESGESSLKEAYPFFDDFIATDAMLKSIAKKN